MILVFSILLFLFYSTEPITPGFQIDWAIRYHSERGVLNQGLINIGGGLYLFDILSFDGVLGYRFCPNWEVGSLGLSATIAPFNTSRVRFQAGVQHTYWQDWNAEEARWFGLVTTQVVNRGDIGLGFCHREQRFNFTNRTLPIKEYNMVYIIRWCLFTNRCLRLSTELSNYSRDEIKIAQQFPLIFTVNWKFNPKWESYYRLGIAMNGFSAGLVTISEIRCEFGVVYAHPFFFGGILISGNSVGRRY